QRRNVDRKIGEEVRIDQMFFSDRLEELGEKFSLVHRSKLWHRRPSRCLGSIRGDRVMFAKTADEFHEPVTTLEVLRFDLSFREIRDRFLHGVLRERTAKADLSSAQRGSPR